ncbi:MAG: hypothetical protein U9Q70_11070 [Chloroflexota bacterium]|nr:hypothetical protein [Chloroflexota bacterium]
MHSGKRKIPLWGLILGTVLLVIMASAGIAQILVRGVDRATPIVRPTLPVAVVLESQKTPRVDIPTPQPTPVVPATPPPTATIPFTLTLPVPTPTLPPARNPLQDALADITDLAGGVAVASPPTGVDIATCNCTSETTVLSELPAPAALLTGTTSSTETLTLWFTLHNPIPAQRTLTYHLLVALDLDGDSATGRPPGDGHINPELGTEIGAGVFLQPNGELEPYIYAWNNALGDWDGDTPDIMTAQLNAERDGVRFDFPLAELRATVEEISGVALDSGALHGRVAVIASSQTEPPVVDFCPDLP